MMQNTTPRVNHLPFCLCRHSHAICAVNLMTGIDCSKYLANILSCKKLKFSRHTAIKLQMTETFFSHRRWWWCCFTGRDKVRKEWSSTSDTLAPNYDKRSTDDKQSTERDCLDQTLSTEWLKLINWKIYLLLTGPALNHSSGRGAHPIKCPPFCCSPPICQSMGN